MPKWNIEARRATLQIFGGELVVTRPGGALLGQWSSAALPEATRMRTPLGHIRRFAIHPDVVRALSPEEGRAIMAAKWAGPHRPWEDTDQTRAFEMRLHGWRGEKEQLAEPHHRLAVAHALADPEGDDDFAFIPGAACFVAPQAIRVHLQQVYPVFWRSVSGEPGPDLYVAEEDPF